MTLVTSFALAELEMSCIRNEQVSTFSVHMGLSQREGEGHVYLVL